MGNPGRFIAVILLIFQLTSSAGTFPIELVPGWLQKGIAFPAYDLYVAGFRDIISSGDYSSIGGYVAIMAGIAILFAVLSYLYFTLSHRKTKDDEVAEQPASLFKNGFDKKDSEGNRCSFFA